MESANTSSMRECVRKGLNRKRVGSVFLVILFHAKEGLKDKCEAFFWHARKGRGCWKTGRTGRL